MAQPRSSPWAGIPYNPDVTASDVAQPSVWAAPSDQLQPNTTTESAPLPKIDLHRNMTPIFAPITPQQEEEKHLSGALQNDYEKDANPMGSEGNHPGFWGKLAHGLSHATGGDTRRQWEEQGLAKQLNDVTGQESQNAEREALTAKANEETAAAPGRNKSEEDLQGAQTENLKNPALQHLETDQGIFAFNPHTKELTPLTYQGQPLNPIAKPGATKGQEHLSVIGPDGKTPIVANYDPATGVTKDASGKVIANPVPYTPPNYASVLPMMLPTHTTTVIDPKTGLPTEYQYNPQTRKYDAPVGQSASGGYGHEAAQAGAVERAGADLIQTLNANRNVLGTLGAWVQSHGLNTPIADPKLAGIQTQLKSFADLNPAMHGSRGGAAMKHFEDLIGGLQKNPDASIAGIQGILRTAHNINPGVQNQGGAEPMVQHSASTNQYRYSMDGGKTWQNGQPPSQK